MVFFYIFASIVCLGSIVNKNAHGLELIDEFIEQNPAENYIMPHLLKKTLQLKRGLNYLQKEIVTYKYLRIPRRDPDKLDRLLNDVLSSVRKDDTTQYLFAIPKLHKIQISYLRQINWPMEKLKSVKVMSTPPSFSCRLLKFNDYIFNLTPSLLKSKICYATDIFVYQLI